MSGGIDYSRFDHIELSDDSDIEVHPNVDKKSFIRWKQRDIHEKRRDRKETIKALQTNIQVSGKIVSALQQIFPTVTNGGKSSDAARAAMIAFQSPNDPDSSSIADFMKELVSDLEKSEQNTQLPPPLSLINDHISRLHEQQREWEANLKTLQKEESSRITSDDLRIGFDSGQSRPKRSAPKEVDSQVILPGETAPKSKIQTKELHTILPEKDALASGAEADVDEHSKADDEEHIEPSVIGRKFGNLTPGDYSQSLNFISANPQVVSEKETDGLLIAAFHAQLRHDDSAAQRFVHQALLLQYCQKLGPDGVALFFKRINTPSHQARRVFLDDVKQTYTKIRSRSQELAKEQEAAPPAGTEQIQLHAVDPDSKIQISVPDPPSDKEAVSDARKIFESFPPGLQRALQSGELDEVNRVLGKMSVDEAEEIVGQFGSSGILSIESTIFDATSGEIQR